MRYFGIALLVVALAGLASWAWAGSAENDPAFANVKQAVIGTSTSTPDVNLVPSQSGLVSTTRDFAAEAPSRVPGSIEKDGLPSQDPPRILWGTDQLIRTGSLPTFGRLSMDHAANGDLYVCLFSPYGTPQDTIFVYRSQDGGLTWSQWQYSNNTAGDDSLVDGFIRVGPGTNPWVYTFAHYSTAGGGLYVRRQRADGTNNSWNLIARGDTVRNVSADRNIENPSTLFLTYRFGASFDGLRLIASYDSGATWTNGRYVASGNVNNPSVCAGGDGYVYLTWAQDTCPIWVGRYTNNLISPSMVFSRVDSTGEGTWNPTIAAARTTPGTSQTAWILNRHMHSNGNADVHMATTTNGSVTWATMPWPITNAGGRTEWDMRYPYLRYSYDYSVPLVSGMAVLAGVYDSVAFGFSRIATPTTWEDRVVPNDYSNTGEFGAVVDNVSGTTGGGNIAYRRYGSPEVWSDTYRGTGVEQGGSITPPSGLTLASARPNPLTRTTSIAFSLPKSGSVDLAVYDIAGRKVATLAQGTMSAGSHEVSWNGAKAPAGVYLYRLSFEGKTLTNRMVVVR